VPGWVWYKRQARMSPAGGTHPWHQHEAPHDNKRRADIKKPFGLYAAPAGAWRGAHIPVLLREDMATMIAWLHIWRGKTPCCYFFV